MTRLLVLLTAAAAMLGSQEISFETPRTTPPLPCNEERSGQLAGRARSALSGGDPAMAAGLFRQAYEACPSNRVLLLEVARALTSQRKFDQAIETANEFLTAEPGSIPGLLVLANALFMDQQWEKCREVLDKVLAVEPDNPTALLLEGNNEYILGNTGEAEKALQRLLARRPEDVDAAYMLGRIYYMDNRAEYAMGMFQRVLRLDPKHYKAWDNLGLCYDAVGDPEMAIRHFLTAIKLVEKDHPEYEWPYANLADLLLRQNRYEEAYRAATQAAKRNPYRARNFFLGGKALIKLGRMKDARKWLERAVALDPDFPDSLYALGQLYIKLGDKQKGIETLKRFREAKRKTPAQRR